MGKKRGRTAYTSKGDRNSTSVANVKLMRKSEAEKIADKAAAWRKGQNPWISMFDPTRQKGRQYYRVRANDYYGNPKHLLPNIYKGRSESE